MNVEDIEKFTKFIEQKLTIFAKAYHISAYIHGIGFDITNQMIRFNVNMPSGVIFGAFYSIKYEDLLLDDEAFAVKSKEIIEERKRLEEERRLKNTCDKCGHIKDMYFYEPFQI